MKITKINPKSKEEVVEDKFKTEITNLAGKSYNQGAKAMGKSIIEAFRAVAMADTVIPTTFTAPQVIGIIKDILKGGPSVVQE